MQISADTQSTAGLILLTVLVVEVGGLVVLRMTRGNEEATPFQVAFARAGHGHAAVLLVLSLIGLILADSTSLVGVWRFIARTGIWVAAILFPTGFFLSSGGEGRTQANRWIIVVYLGGLVLAVTMVTLGVGLLAAAG